MRRLVSFVAAQGAPPGLCVGSLSREVSEAGGLQPQTWVHVQSGADSSKTHFDERAQRARRNARSEHFEERAPASAAKCESVNAVFLVKIRIKTQSFW